MRAETRSEFTPSGTEEKLTAEIEFQNPHPFRKERERLGHAAPTLSQRARQGWAPGTRPPVKSGCDSWRSRPSQSHLLWAASAIVCDGDRCSPTAFPRRRELHFDEATRTRCNARATSVRLGEIVRVWPSDRDARDVHGRMALIAQCDRLGQACRVDWLITKTYGNRSELNRCPGSR